jgi:hypothetical protein
MMTNTEPPTEAQCLAADEAAASFHDARRQHDEAITAHVTAKAEMIACKIAHDRAKANELEARTLKDDCLIRYRTTFREALHSLSAVKSRRIGHVEDGKILRPYIESPDGTKHWERR